MRPSLHRLVILAAVAAVGGSGCARDRAASAPSSIVISAVADPNTLFPPAALNIEARQATELLFEYLADVGVEMNTVGDSGFVAQLASSWTWSSDSSSIAFHINPRARWHDGVPVTSRDVAFSYSVYNDPRVASMLLGPLSTIDSVVTPDSTTAVFWFRTRGPRQFFTASSMMLILPQHLLGAIPRDSLPSVAAGKDPVGSGPYRFSRWTRGETLELSSVQDHYRGAPSTGRLIWSIAPEYQTGLLRLRGGQAHVLSNVRIESIPELTADGNFAIHALPGMDYVFMQFNLRDSTGRAPHRFFGSRDLRRAVSMAIDRKSMVKNLFDTLAAVSIGPAVRAFPTTDTALVQIPFDPLRASALLDSLGWIQSAKNASGDIQVRTRNGIPLQFRVLVPVSSASRMKLAVLLQEQLRRVGVNVIVDQMDYSAFSARQASRTFDAALASWHLGSSPEAVRTTWTSTAAERGGLNYGGYRNSRFDALVDSALDANALASSRAYFKSANQTIIDDAPAVWLYEPRTLLAVRKPLRPGAMRPNAWWLGIEKWQTNSRP